MLVPALVASMSFVRAHSFRTLRAGDDAERETVRARTHGERLDLDVEMDMRRGQVPGTDARRAVYRVENAFDLCLPCCFVIDICSAIRTAPDLRTRQKKADPDLSRGPAPPSVA